MAGLKPRPDSSATHACMSGCRMAANGTAPKRGNVRDQAEHAAESLAKGSRVVVMGRLQQRAWTAEDGAARSVVEVVAEELGPSLRWATATTPGRHAAPSGSQLDQG